MTCREQHIRRPSRSPHSSSETRLRWVSRRFMPTVAHGKLRVAQRERERDRRRTMWKTRDRDAEYRMEHFQGYVPVERKSFIAFSGSYPPPCWQPSLPSRRLCGLFSTRVDDWPSQHHMRISTQVDPTPRCRSQNRQDTLHSACMVSTMAYAPADYGYADRFSSLWEFPIPPVFRYTIE
jgi:hypothetical protein